MNNVYLLLRNNKQTGPHSLEALIQLGLQSQDLVWVEGKSSCWMYPSEISALKPYVAPGSDQAVKRAGLVNPDPLPETQVHQPEEKKKTATAGPVVPKNIYVSMPTAGASKPAPTVTPQSQQEPLPVVDLEKKAEEIRRRALESTPSTTPAAGDGIVNTKYARSLSDVESDYTSWVYKKKATQKKGISKNKAAAVLLIIFILTAGYGISRYDFSDKESETIPLTATGNLTDENTASEESLLPQQPLEDPELTQPLQEPASPVQNSTVSSVRNDSEMPAGTNTTTAKNDETGRNTMIVSKNDKKTSPVKIETTPGKNPGSQSPQPNVAVSAPPQAPETAVDIKKQPESNTKNSPAEKSEEETVSASPKKKKTFVEKLDNLFGIKRKGQEEKPVDEAEETSQKPVYTERKAKRRDDDNATAAPAENLADLVDITSNGAAGGDWLLGVYGMELTVRNRSSQIVKSAAIEVRYYNQQKELLEKKVVNCKNVHPESSVRVPVPDHRLADHTDYRLVSVKN